MAPEALESLVAQYRQRGAAALKVQGELGNSDPVAFERVGNVAVIQIAGPMQKYPDLFMRFFGGTSTLETEEAINRAVADQSIETIALLIDSPGGQISGTGDLADTFHAAGKVKKTVAYISDLGASAAYWVASQARKVYANPSAVVGSIGTYAVVMDMSAMAAALGIKVHVIRAGEFKGSGTQGTSITDSQLGEFQRVVNSLNELFLASVTRGRRMNPAQVNALADGRVHVGEAAVKLGLIDGIAKWDTVLAGRVSSESSDFESRQITHSGPNDRTQAERAARLRAAEAAAPPKAAPPPTDQEIVAAWDAKLASLVDGGKPKTIAVRELVREDPEAHAAYVESFNRLRKGLNAASMGPINFAGDAIAEFTSRVAEAEARGVSRREIVGKIARLRPELHKAYVAEVNRRAGRRVPAWCTEDPTRLLVAQIRNRFRGFARVVSVAEKVPKVIARWNAEMLNRTRAGKPQSQATRELVRDEPELHSAFLTAYNIQHAQHGRLSGVVTAEHLPSLERFTV